MQLIASTSSDTPVRPLPLTAALPRVGLAGFVAVGLVKIVVMMLFSSGYMNELFVPFVKHFVGHFDNTWNFFYQASAQRDQFPYQPLMLYLIAAAAWPLNLIGWNNWLFVNLFMKLPTLICDVTVCALLVAMFPSRKSHVFWYYWLSPIVLYACYMHSQLDLLPTAILFSGVYFLRRKSWVKSALLTGLSVATKTHVLAALPLFLIYLLKNQTVTRTILFTLIVVAVALGVAAPYLGSPGFSALVLHNPKQSQIFDAHLDIGSMKIYLPVFASCMAYGRFALYPKINTDLLDAFFTMVFSLFVLLVVPAPGWYVWIAPFLSLFMVKYGSRDYRVVASCLVLYASYLLYFLLFHRFDYTDLIFLNVPLNFKLASDSLSSLAFTFLELSLLANILLFYKIGVKSNSIYRRDQAIVIGIGGDSGAGKSTLLKDVKNLLGDKVLELEGDADHKWERGNENWRDLTHLDPKANFLHRQAQTILELKRGRAVRRVQYDHDTGTFTSAQLVEPNDFVVLSGLHTFYLPKMRKLIDLKIFMDPDRDVKTHWKLRRDVSERGYSQSQVITQMNRRKSDVCKFIEPQREFADLCVRYFSAGQFDANDAAADPSLLLGLSLSSSIHLEELVERLTRAGLLATWDYSDDLSRQTLTLSSPVPMDQLRQYAQELVPNLDELLNSEILWEEGYRGFVQLMILLVLSDLMKDKEDYAI